MARDDATHLAAGVAYYALFSLFPLLLGLLAIMGLGLNSESAHQGSLAFMADNLPGSSQFMESNGDGILRLQGTLGIDALFGLSGRAVNRAQ